MSDRLHVYAPGDGPAIDMYRDFADIRLVPYERLMMPKSPPAVARAISALVRDVATFRKLFRRDAIDTVLCATTATPAAALAARISGLTSVIYCGELFDTGSAASGGRRLASRAMQAAVPRIADLVICCSDRAAAQFTSNARATVVRLYPPIDRNRPVIDALEARATFALPLDRPVVVSIGALSPGRGQDVAIAALGHLRHGPSPAVLAIAGAPGGGPGDESYARDLVGLATASDVESAVHFLGPVSDITALLSAADVFVNPARYEEPFGRAALEALAAGVPAIVTRTGAQTELLRDEYSALVVPPDDPAAIARAVSRLLASPALADRLVKGAAESLRALDPELDRARFRRLLNDAG
jgi:glycosyltransferase involved in cell wall biosynthesis